MASLGSLIVDIAANTSQLRTDLDKARKEIGTFGGQVQAGIATVGKFGVALVGLEVGRRTIQSIVAAAKDVVLEFANSERQMLRLQAVLRATGNTAGVSAGELKELATSLSRSSLFDDKQILAASAQLLTFENISGTALTKAIRLSVDLASLWDGDVSAAAFGLGKALQEPATAAEGLRRAKVKLTDEEKRAIQAFIELGDVAGAQGVVFKALEDRVGGVAAGQSSGLSGAFHRLGEQIEDAKEKLGGFLAPSLNLFAAKISETIALLGKLGTAVGGGQGLGSTIEAGLRNASGLTVPGALRPSRPLDELVVQPSRDLLDKQVQDRLTLLSAGRATAADVASLRETAQADVEALKLTNLELTTQARLTKELVSIRTAFAALQSKEVSDLSQLLNLQRASIADVARLLSIREADVAAIERGNLALGDRARREKEVQDIETLLGLNRLSTSNLGPLRDLTRVGATPEEEAAIRAAIQQGNLQNGRLSSAMVGIGGEPIDKRARDRAAAAAQFFRETWINAIRGAQDSLAQFFANIGRGTNTLIDLLKGIAQEIQNLFAQLAARSVINAIFPSLAAAPATGDIGDSLVGVPTFHRGGIVGEGAGGTARVSPLAFVGAPRLHRGGFLGLRPDEVPFIGTRGERVLSPAETATFGRRDRAASPTVVNVAQTISFNLSAIDGVSAAQFIRSQGAAIAGVVADAASAAPAFARHILAAGAR